MSRVWSRLVVAMPGGVGVCQMWNGLGQDKHRRGIHRRGWCAWRGLGLAVVVTPEPEGK
jgi:hypothetical protein